MSDGMLDLMEKPNIFSTHNTATGRRKCRPYQKVAEASIRGSPRNDFLWSFQGCCSRKSEGGLRMQK